MSLISLTSYARTRIFKGKLTEKQEEAIDAVVRQWQTVSTLDTELAYDLATAQWETAGKMLPVRETLATSDKQAITRLDNAFAKGQMPYVKTPYWRDGWFGRGMVQLTHEDNYQGDMQAAVLKQFPGKDIHADPSLLINDLNVSAFCLAYGMHHGLFTKYKLTDFITDTKTDYLNARKVVNPKDLASFDKIKELAVAWQATIKAARGGALNAPVDNLYDGAYHHEVEDVQKKFIALNITSIGMPDGIWGKKTRDAVVSFRMDHGLPLVTTITDPDFVKALFQDAEPVPPPAARQDATAADLTAGGSKIMEHVNKIKTAVVGTGVALGGVSSVDGALSQAEQWNGYAGRAYALVAPVFHTVKDNWILIVLALLGFVGWQIWKVQKSHVDDFKDGKLNQP